MRIFAALTIGLLSTLAFFAAAVGVAGSWAVAVAIGLAGGALAGWRAWLRPFVPLDEAACTRGLKVVSALATLASLALIGRLTLFMVDPKLVRFSTRAARSCRRATRASPRFGS